MIKLKNFSMQNSFIKEISTMAVSGLKAIGAGNATSGVGGAGMGIGVVFGSYIIAVSKNKDLERQLFSYTILGFALVEAIALFALMMGFLILFM
jgi:F-type H+-transporting ATPase subunit c